MVLVGLKWPSQQILKVFTRFWRLMENVGYERNSSLSTFCYNVNVLLNFQTEMCTALKPIPKEDTLKTEQLAEDGKPNFLIHGR